ncbi:MAG: hypothetical protein ACE5FT_02000 [Candidatus Nanoarchaeia archaeon]
MFERLRYSQLILTFIVLLLLSSQIAAAVPKSDGSKATSEDLDNLLADNPEEAIPADRGTEVPGASDARTEGDDIRVGTSPEVRTPGGAEYSDGENVLLDSNGEVKEADKITANSPSGDAYMEEFVDSHNNYRHQETGVCT